MAHTHDEIIVILGRHGVPTAVIDEVSEKLKDSDTRTVAYNKTMATLKRHNWFQKTDPKEREAIEQYRKKELFLSDYLSMDMIDVQALAKSKGLKVAGLYKLALAGRLSRDGDILPKEEVNFDHFGIRVGGGI